MKCIKTIAFGTSKMRFKINSDLARNYISGTFDFNRTTTRYNKYNISLFEIDEKNLLRHGRYDNLVRNEKNMSLEIWFKNTSVNVDPKKNHIISKILTPTSLLPTEILDLTIMEPLRHFLRCKGKVLIHAAAVAKDNKAILICGPTKSGKSTLAIKLMEKGFKFISDEMVIIDKGCVFPFPFKIGLTKKSLKMFPKLKKLIQENSEKVYFDIRKFYPRCCIENCPPKVIIFLSQNKFSKKTLLLPIDKQIAFPLLCIDKENVMLQEKLVPEKNIVLRQKQIQALANLCEKTQAYFLHFRFDRINKAYETIAELMNSPA